MSALATQRPPALPTEWRWAALVASGATTALGLVVLTGWHTSNYALIQIAPGLAAMQYNTALCFVLCGLALGAWLQGRSKLTIRCAAAIVAAIGLLTTCEHLFHGSLGVDNLLFHASPTVQRELVARITHAGRMSPPSALCFSALGTALLALGAGAKRWSTPLAGILASLVISLGLIALVGYVFGLPGTYGWGQMARVAAQTAGGYVVLGTGLLIAAWHAGQQPTERTPRWLPVALALAITTASFVLYSALDTKQNEEIARVVHAGAESVKSQITIRTEARLRSLVRMASRWQIEGRPTQAAWELETTNFLRDVPDMQAIEWIDNSHRVRWVAPLKGNESKIGLNVATEARRAAAIAQAERERQPVITRTVSLFHGGLGYVVYVPVIVDGQPDGVLATVFQAEPLFARYLPAGIADRQAIRVTEGGLTVYEREAGAAPSRPEWSEQEQVDLHGVTWQVYVWPTPALLAQLDDPLPEIVLGAALFGGILLATVCFLAQRASRLARLAAHARDAMQRALEEVKTLKGLLPICACCKRIRDDTGYWSQVDTYIHRHTDAKLSHGYCPECAVKAFTKFGLEVPEKVRAELAERNFE